MQCGNNLLEQLKSYKESEKTPIRPYLDSTPNVPFSFAARNSIDGSRDDFINVFLQGKSFNLFENLVMVINS